MKLQFMGAVRTVTGSMHLLTVNGARILLECGLYQGRRKEAFRRNRNLPFDAAQIDAMVLSHAHIDHSGNIPSLVAAGFTGNIYATPATRDLCSAMLRDSGHIHEQDAAYVNKKHAQRGLPPVEPLYTVEDAIESLQYFVSVGYGRPFPVAPGVTVTYLDAGHILGAAVVVLDVEEDGRTRRLLFTGDLGREDMPILRDPRVMDGVDILITESTYGDRTHPVREDQDRALRDIVVDTYKRGGKLIIPAFAVGRTQELVYAFHRMVEARRVPDQPVFVDSPLAVNVTEIFRLHPECYDEELRTFISHDGHRDPFGFYRLRYIRLTEDSKELNFLREPAVIISASGMCEAGRILHHLKNNIEDPRTTVLIVGWQAPHTLGRRIMERQPVVKIFGVEYRLNARVETLLGFSAHADRTGLLEYAGTLRDRGPVQAAFVVHGEEEASLALAEGLRQLGIARVQVPEEGRVYEM
jgi:metallo-beta-lactamase family protein